MLDTSSEADQEEVVDSKLDDGHWSSESGEEDLSGNTGENSLSSMIFTHIVTILSVSEQNDVMKTTLNNVHDTLQTMRSQLNEMMELTRKLKSKRTSQLDLANIKNTAYCIHRELIDLEMQSHKSGNMQ